MIKNLSPLNKKLRFDLWLCIWNDLVERREYILCAPQLFQRKLIITNNNRNFISINFALKVWLEENFLVCLEISVTLKSEIIINGGSACCARCKGSCARRRLLNVKGAWSVCYIGRNLPCARRRCARGKYCFDWFCGNTVVGVNCCEFRQIRNKNIVSN
jgi:hypothetical protein